ncbi:MAG: hypothetical protein JNM88_11320 [Chitinophagaceae bacterium]|nr:hypothetical protein [Chitinophagaceae bacterium]
MTKKSVWMALQVLLFLAFNFLFFLTILFLFKKNNVFDKIGLHEPVYNGTEVFDPSLQRLNSIKKLEDYCDSLYSVQSMNSQFKSDEGNYPVLVDSVMRQRFYHGYSRYRFSENYMALLLEPLTGKEAAAIVIPDDMLKYPYAACSQQSILMMELLKRKGYSTRKVGFLDKQYGGHFCFEVLYNGSWHFFDTNQEPDMNVLNVNNRPGIAFLSKNKEVLRAAYPHLEPERLDAIFGNYFFGKPDTFEAPRARIYQQVTKILSYCGWFFALLAYVLVRKKRTMLMRPERKYAGLFLKAETNG